jgi:hypothetical protein
MEKNEQRKIANDLNRMFRWLWWINLMIII